MRWCVGLLFVACAVETPGPEPEKTVKVQSTPPPAEPVTEAPGEAPSPNVPSAPAPSGPTGPTTPSGSLEPTPPAGLVRYLVGDDDDATPALPASGEVLFMGGGTDVDAAFAYAASRAPNGDAVILRASGADGYNDYLFTDIGGFDSVETLMVTTKALADAPYVAWRIRHAELVFMAGGAQDVYLKQWSGTALAGAVNDAFANGALVGGTSAGAMTAGDPVYAAYDGSIVSDDALADPFDDALDLDASPFVLVTRTLVDTHFTQRDRLGRLVAFLARAYATPLWGLGVDEKTALVLSANGSGKLFGAGKVRVLYADHAAQTLTPGTPLTYRHLKARTLSAPATIANVYDVNALSEDVDCVNGALQ